MCGLTGISTEYATKEDKNILYTLYMLSALRGMDGCGSFFWYKELDKTTNKLENYYDHEKSEEPVNSFVNSEEFKNILDLNFKLFLGHARAATVGKVHLDNNHPFNLDNLIGMHNGTIRGDFKYSKDFETDSEALFKVIEEEGLKEGLKRVHTESNHMAFAIQYYDKVEDKIHIIRNSERTLYFAMPDKEKYGKNEHIPPKAYWSSEYGMLSFALARHGMYGKFDIKALEPGALVTIDMTKDGRNKFTYTPNFFQPPKPVFNKGVGYPYNNTHPSNQTKPISHNPTNKNKIKEYLNKNKQGASTKIPNNTSHYQTKPLVSKSEDWDYFKIGTFKVREDLFEKNLGRGCCICNNPEFLFNAWDLKMKFLPDQKTDFICEQCLNSHEDDELLTSYGIDSKQLLEPKLLNEV